MRPVTRIRLGPWIAALGGALWCSTYIRPLLDPFRLDLVLHGDWAQHTLGWLFFRRESLSFPLGSIRGFLYPFGTTLGYMDSIPWVALVLRFFEGFLPRDFQYLGLWMVACSGLLGFVAARVAALSTRYWEQQALAGMLVAFAPSLVDRVVHPALCAHFLLVAGVALHWVPSHDLAAARRKLIAAFALLGLSTATHPYLAFMVLAILIALPMLLLRQLGVGVAVAASLGLCGLLVAELVLLGYVGGPMQNATEGFGEFSANLNTFINSEGYSRLFPALPYASLQYEGYSYLGAGCFLMCAVAFGLLLRKRTRAAVASFPWRRAVWPLMAALGLAVFALATPWRWGEREILHIPLYEHVAWLGRVFRSSGRLIWALAYMLNLAVITCVLRGLRAHRAAASAVLLAALALQAYDIDTTSVQPEGGPPRKARFSAPAWELADGTFKHLVMYPAEIAGVCESPNGYRGDEVNALAYLAYVRGMTFNSGYAARVHIAADEQCKALEHDVRSGKLRADTIYVTQRRELKRFVKAGATCGRINRAHVCVLPKDHPLAAYLSEHKKR